ITARMGELVENIVPRRQIYELALHAIGQRPLLGTGLGTFGQIFRMLRDEDFGPQEAAYDVVHNSYLELALEAGLPATAMLYLALLLFFLALLLGVRTRRRAVIFPCGGIATMAMLGLHAVVDFSLQIPAITATFAFICGVASAQ